MEIQWKLRAHLDGRKSLTPHAHTKPVGEVGASKQGSVPHGLDWQRFVTTSRIKTNLNLC